jgi:hypothetical protein
MKDVRRNHALHFRIRRSVFPAVYFIFTFELKSKIANNYIRIIRKLGEHPGLSGIIRDYPGFGMGWRCITFFIDVMMA